MTDAIVCDRCGDAIPREEWERHVHGVVEISYVEVQQLAITIEGRLSLTCVGIVPSG